MNALGLPLFASPATRRAMLGMRGAVILVGGYDGSGNYGDIVQLDVALSLLEPLLGPKLLALPLLERARRRGHDDLSATFNVPPEHALYFDPEGLGEDDLVPVAVPASLAAGAIYLYGGGYLNPSWGERKLAMLRAAEELLRGAGVAGPTRVATGLQVDPTWIADLPVGDTAMFRSYEMLGARDPLTARALSELAPSATVLDTADDAIGALGAAPDRPDRQGGLTVNIHLGEHEWVSDRPGRLRDLALDLVTELGRGAELPVRIRPLIAYLDSRIDERPTVAALVEEASRRKIGVEETLVLRPSTLEAGLPELGSAAATISSSYHVALTSLQLGVPTAIFADNPYYEQKAAGLADTFGLPSSFILSAASDPADVAAAILGEDATGGGIARGGAKMRRLRARAEVEVLGRLAGGLLKQMDAVVGRLDARVQELGAEPADLRIELAALRTANEELRPPAIEAAILAVERSRDRAEERAHQAEQRALQAEQRAAEAVADSAAAHERLAELLGSRSWKLGERPRRAGAALRRFKGPKSPEE